jgi:hypothetical protein
MYAILPGYEHVCMRKEGFVVFRSFGQLTVAPLTAALLSEVGSDGSHAR